MFIAVLQIRDLGFSAFFDPWMKKNDPGSGMEKIISKSLVTIFWGKNT
jgi:hypothetical protein